MKNNRKVLYPLAALLLSIVLAACAGTREITDFQITHDNGEPTSIEFTTQGETFHLAGRVTFDNQTVDAVIPELIDWSSEDPSIATVNAAGEVQAVSAGTTTITGAHKGFSDTVEIIVPVW